MAKTYILKGKGGKNASSFAGWSFGGDGIEICGEKKSSQLKKTREKYSYEKWKYVAVEHVPRTTT